MPPETDDDIEAADPKTLALSFKAPQSFEKRLKAAAKATGLTKSAIALAAVDAVLSAIERDKGLVVPVGFKISLVPERVPELIYPEQVDADIKVAQPDGAGPGEGGRQALLRRAEQAGSSPAGKATPAAHK